MRKYIGLLLTLIGPGWVGGAVLPEPPLVLIQPVVREQRAPGDFPLVASGQAAPVWVDAGDFTVVRLAADLFAGDVQRVSGVKPALLTNQPPRTGQAVLIGTLGHSALIDRLVTERKLDVSAIRGQWESHVIATVADPLPEVKSALVIVGSDRRGTAYGVFSLSEAMGVSPWYWWADVTPAHRDQVFVAGGTWRQGPPAVKYRGIFINDENYGLRPWAVKNFETDRKYIGPKTYAKIFELLLRLKANYCWPAMHVGTGYFNVFPENKQVADDYAIVMGSSHCEPMLVNNIYGGHGEWNEKKDGPWNFVTNRDRIVGLWEKRLRENGKFENSYTIGLRGLSDQPIEGGRTIPEKVAILQQAINTERELLARYVNSDPTKICQIFCPYQEVLTLYQAGVKVPEDVTLVWPDDNHGYIRQLSTPEEQKRSGGSGVYHHLAYWTWVWLCPISPSLVGYEMTKAYEYKADRVWVFNVGDIKPAEKELTFAMQMAWDIKRWNAQNADQFLAEWAGATFGKEFGDEIAGMFNEYYRLAARGFPESLEFDKGCYAPSEIKERLETCKRIAAKAEAVGKRMPARLKDAYYQLVLYPVKGAALVNQKVLLAKGSLELAARGDSHALDLAAQASQALQEVTEMTRYYNEDMVGGKWNHMMGWFPRRSPQVATPELVEAGKIGKAAFTSVSLPDPVEIVPANKFVRKQERPDATVHVFPKLGFAPGISILPFTAPSLKNEEVKQAAWVEYELNAPAGPLFVQVRTLPNRRVYPERAVRYAVSVNGAEPVVFDIEAENGSLEWFQNIERGYSTRRVSFQADSPQKINVRVYLLDPGVVLQDIAVLLAQKSIPAGCIDLVNMADDELWEPTGKTVLGIGARGKVFRLCASYSSVSWKMNVLPDQPNRLICTYWSAEGNVAFDILIDGVKVATQTFERTKPDRFFDVAYALPEDLTRGKRTVTVKFQPQRGKSAASLYGLRVVR